jgi:hypothetical protein
VLVPAAIALDAQEAVIEQPTLQLVFELLANEPGQVPAAALDLVQGLFGTGFESRSCRWQKQPAGAP